MRIFVLYVIVALILNVFSLVVPRFFHFLNRSIVRLDVYMAYPTTKGLSYIQTLINRYIVLVNLQKENKKLKKELTECEIYNNILKKQLDEKHSNKLRLLEASFSFKGNFKTDAIFLHVKHLDLSGKYCFVLSDRLNLIGIVDKRLKKGVYLAKTVFSPSFVADVFILSDNKRYKALFIGDIYTPKVEFLDPNIPVKSSDKVFTSGDFDVYPPGLYIGKLSKVKDVNGYYKMAYVYVDRSFFNNWKVYILCKKK